MHPIRLHPSPAPFPWRCGGDRWFAIGCYYPGFFSREGEKTKDLIYEQLSDNSRGLCQIPKSFPAGEVQSGWHQEGTGQVMDAEEHHRHSSSQRREESPGLWPSIRPPWINCCVSSLFREFSSQRRPACCPLIGGISLGLCRPCEGHGKIMELWNQRNTGSQNLAMGKVLVSNLGLWAATTKLMWFNKP